MHINLKYLTRPEKCCANYSLGAMFLRTTKKVFVHPIALKGSVDFVSEPWNRLPLINATLKFNIIQLDVGIYVILQLRQAIEAMKTILSYSQEEWQRFQRMRLHANAEGKAVNRNALEELKYPCASFFLRHNKSLTREEFYQDDLR